MVRTGNALDEMLVIVLFLFLAVARTIVIVRICAVYTWGEIDWRGEGLRFLLPLLAFSLDRSRRGR